VHVQAFVTQLAVEAFDEAVVRSLPRPTEINPNAVMIRPEVEETTVVRSDPGSPARSSVALVPGEEIDRQ
jgi:hypothetical protein